MRFGSLTEPYVAGGVTRQRVSFVVATDLPGPATLRIIGDPPQPLSQYEGNFAGYRLEHTERGHLIGLQFGGPEQPDNLVPMYAGFNGASGAWGIFEQELAAHLATQGNRVTVKVQCYYAQPDATIPHMFLIGVEATAGVALPATFQAFRNLMQPPCVAIQDPITHPDTVLRDALVAEYSEMVAARWFVEQMGITVGVRAVPLQVGCIAPGTVAWGNQVHAQAFYRTRPYAVFDWLWYTKRQRYTALGLASPGTISNTTGFSGPQRSMIRKFNILIHDGWLVSDLWGITDRERYQFLIMSSTDAQAQIDHIAGRSGSGSNAFSNARVISSELNKTLNDERESGIVQRHIDRLFAG